MTDLTPNEQKEITKLAIKEWMDERYAEIGRWTVKSLLVMGVTGFLIWYIQVRGFKLP